MHSIWSGSISFGLVVIPIRLYSAVEDHEIHLTMLHKKDNSPIRYAKICKAEEKEVDYKDITKAYEYEKNEYVIISDKDFEKVNLKSSHTIDIVQFIKESEVDSRYYDKPYYLEPNKGAAKAYALLRGALVQSKKVALVKFILRNHESLGILKATDDALVLNRIRYQAEIHDINKLDLPDVSVKKKEIEMALALIKQSTKVFKPEKFHDNYKEYLHQIIAQKLKGKSKTQKIKITPKAGTVDLMKALKASLEKKRIKKATRRGKRAA